MKYGYVVAPPTDGYKLIQGKEIPIVTIDEREILLDAARSFNEIIEEVKPQHTTKTSQSFSVSPFEDYNKRGDIAALLQSHGWSVVKQTNDKIIFLRPGKTDSKSSGDYNFNLGWFSVFTTSTEFQVNKAYKPSAVFCLLECNNNWSECSRKLIDQGYGEKVKAIPEAVKHQVFKMIEQGESKDDIVFLLKTKPTLQLKKASQLLIILLR